MNTLCDVPGCSQAATDIRPVPEEDYQVALCRNHGEAFDRASNAGDLYSGTQPPEEDYRIWCGRQSGRAA